MAEKTERKLTDAEKRRLENFIKTEEEMKGKGYREQILTISINKANLFAVVLLIPLFVIGVPLFFLVNNFEFDFGRFDYIILMVSFVVLIIVHELVHGATWAVFTQNHFRDIEFGFNMEGLAPYCTCSSPLKKKEYLIGALMPLILVGIVPTLIGIFTGSFVTLVIGLFMIDGAAGDIMVVNRLLSYKTDAAEILCIDHPTDAGLAVFER